MKRRRNCRTLHGLLLLLMMTFGWKDSSFVSAATGNHAFRIHVSYGSGLDQNVGSRNALQRMVKEVFVQSAVSWLENALKVGDVANSTIRVIRDCSNRHYLIKGVRHCIGSCSSTTTCGEAVVPESHLEQCQTCNSKQNRCDATGPTRPGVSGTDFILYVTAVTTKTCQTEKAVSHSLHCQQEKSLDRPVVGNLNICPNRVSYLAKDYQSQVQYIIHDMFHVLAFSPLLYGFYRDSNGLALTPRNKDGLPLSTNSGFVWSNDVIQYEQISDWETSSGKVNHSVAYMVTPMVKAAVQSHFNCRTLKGAPMELQVSPYYHWENRLFQGEMMSGDTNQYLVISNITLAALEDTGWYTADYSYGQAFTWGKGLGCDFAKKSCLGYINSRKKFGQDATPFCEQRPSANSVTCSSDRRSIAKCNLVEHSSPIPKEYRYFAGTSGFSDKSGGEDKNADYCPYYQKFVLSSGQDSRCFVEGNQPVHNIGLESYGASSVCLNHGRQWTATRDGISTSLTRTGAGCYNITCSTNKVIIVQLKGTSKTYSCTTKGQEVLVSEIINGVKYFGSFYCPPFDDVCRGYGCTKVNDCSGHGHCISGACICDPGYYGSDCRSRYFDRLQHCKSQPCLNQGTCQDSTFNYKCLCRTGTSGTNCEINQDECHSNPCQNGGTCVDGVNSFTCQCKVGYEGTLCETDIKECSSGPCMNGGKCLESENRYTCRCTAGYSGINCEIKLACPPCFNNGTCRPSSTGIPICDCPIGWGGALCTKSVRYCDSNPCTNGGTCTEKQGGFSCACQSGYIGSQCETKIVPCSAGLCRNGGSCQDTSTGFQCTCMAGFTGDKCDVNVDECTSMPCKNGATCEDRRGSFHCRCMSGYTGFLCEIDTNECDSNPCHNNAICHDLVDSFRCECQPGYFGSLCSQDVNDCKGITCQNGGKCVDEINSYHCSCRSGFSGHHCETNIPECSSSPCKNGGNCIDEVGGFQCECLDGHTGLLCESEIDECASNPCQNGGTCEDHFRNYTCNCDAGYTGMHCDVDINDCVSQPCLNGGQCIDGENSYTCDCPTNQIGVHCETVKQIPNLCDSKHCCDSKPCNGGTCTTVGPNHFLCFCSLGFSGLLCESEIDNCLSSPCPHGSQCVSHLSGYSCNECASSPCVNDGQCVDKQQGFVCHCPTGYSGAQCEIDLNECDPMPCLNGGRCIDGAGQYTCICTDGYEGTDCDKNADECLSHPCMNNGTCVDSVASYSCLCEAGYTGERCDVIQQDCLNLPCYNGGTCVVTGGFHYCDCLPSYTGSQCEINFFTNECLSRPCLNNGRCIDQVGGFHCDCDAGFQGDWCEENVDDCKNHLCQNGGQCVDAVTTYSCICPRRYTGQFCSKAVNPCDSDPCTNGGTCYVNVVDNSFSCLCTVGYRGDTCEHVVPPVCLVVDCLNGGTCVELQGAAVCKCQLGYSGSWCETRDSPCVSRPCLNGGTCRLQRNSFEGYKCLCLDRFDGKNCENKRGVCSSNPCKNGGACVENSGNDIIPFSCLCPSGYVGLLCESKSSPCYPNPCANNGVCQPNLQGGFRCTCVFPYTGLSCRSTISVPSFQPITYLSLHSVLTNSGSSFGIAFSLYPRSEDGLVLSSAGNSGNHIALGLSHGKVEFQYNYGAVQGLVTSNSSLSLNQWHTIRISHGSNQEELIVDNNLPVRSISHGGTNISLQNYVVGHNSLVTDIKFYRGFSGCISNLAVNSHAIQLDGSTVLMSNGVGDCFADDQCGEGFCLNGGTCIHVTDIPVCACSHGFTGRRCEHQSSFVLPFFSGRSYLLIRTPIVSGTTVTVSLTFRTSKRDGLLLYMSEFLDGSGDFFAVYLAAGRVVFGFDSGSGSGWLRSTSVVALNQYVKVTASKQGTIGDLSVDSREFVTGQSQGPFTTTSLQAIVYIGGVPSSVLLPTALGVAGLSDSSYVGCVSELTINGKRINLSSSNLDVCSTDVQDCAAGSDPRQLPAFATPSFSGNSYLRYDVTPRFQSRNEWTVEFKPTAASGVVFYVGQPSNTSSDRYLYLQLSNGYAQVRFDFDGGEQVVSSRLRLRMGEWHTVSVSRSGSVVTLVVNDEQHSAITPSPGSQEMFTLPNSVFLGGLPSVSNVLAPVQGLTGCIRSVHLDGSINLALQLQAVVGVEVAECSVEELR